MSQYRKGGHVRNQPQFDIRSPLYSNSPVWPGADFVREHNGSEPKEIRRADLEGLVGGGAMLADGNIIRRFVWVLRFMSWIAYGFLVSHDKRMLSVECRENCKTNENYHLNVARHAFSCSMRFGPIRPVWYSCMRIMPYQVLKMYLCCLTSGFPTWASNGVGITCTFFFESLLYPLYVLLLMSLTIFMGDALNSHRCRRKSTSVVRRGYFVCRISPSFLDVVTLMTFPLVTMLQKGPFHLEQRIYDFVLPGLWHSFRFCCL